MSNTDKVLAGSIPKLYDTSRLGEATDIATEAIAKRLNNHMSPDAQ